jgi:ABC-type glycerol-3-phosphate transport system permease component
MTGISAFGKQRAGRGTARRWRHRWAAIALAVITLIFLVPFFWVLSQSLEPSAEFSRNLATLWPSHPTLGNYYTVLIRDSFSRSILSSFIVAAITTVITLVLGALAGYALARLPIRGRGFVLGFVILAGFFPLTAMMGPLFEVMSHIGLLNTYLGLSIADLIYTVPLTTWLLASLFGQIPMEIEEAALVDGASRLGAVWRIIVPLAAPALVTAAIFSFLLVWNDFAFSLAFLQTTSRFTAPLSIVMLSQTKYQVFYNLTDAGVLLTALPIFVLVLFAQRRIVSGLTTGALR